MSIVGAGNSSFTSDSDMTFFSLEWGLKNVSGIPRKLMSRNKILES